MSNTQKLSHMSEGGIVLGMSQDSKRLYINSEDSHSLIIGATRSGKSRNIVLPTICTTALAEESMVVMDPKAELYLYAYPFLERLGYEVITIDFKNPQQSDRYNFLQPVIDAVNSGDTALAVMRARDIATMLVPDGHTNERIWQDGERSTLTMAILAVTIDNLNHPEYQNLSNAHQFIANMCKPIGSHGNLPIIRYLEDQPEEHPARLALGTAQIAPSKMRGSFYTSAITSLDLFTDVNIHALTSATDFDYRATGQRKRAIFIILPDHKSTYYPLASLFVYQQYQTLVDESDKCGNRLPRRVNFICDEFGNFSKIPDIEKLITVSAGRGCRFHLFVQDFNQITERYGDNLSKTIRANADTWIYLQTDDPTTLRELSDKLDKYTIKTPSLSGSTGGNTSASYSYTGRELLMPGEIKRIRRPYQLVLTKNDPAIMYAPDISKTIFNKMLGLGDKAHNAQVILVRNRRRKEHETNTHYWGIWDYYIRLIALQEGE